MKLFLLRLTSVFATMWTISLNLSTTYRGFFYAHILAKHLVGTGNATEEQPMAAAAARQSGSRSEAKRPMAAATFFSAATPPCEADRQERGARAGRAGEAWRRCVVESALNPTRDPGQTTCCCPDRGAYT